MKWLQIETAPKDATPIDLWVPFWSDDLGRGQRVPNMKREDLGNGNVFYSPVYAGPCCVRNASHWLPIPDAPDA